MNDQPLFTLRLDFPLISVNEVMHKSWQQTYSIEQQLKNTCGWLILEALRKQRLDIPLGVLVRIRYTVFVDDNKRVVSDRDPGNIFGKYCTDALVQAGVLVDDNWRFVSEESYRIDPLPPGETKPFTRVELFNDGVLRIKPGKALVDYERKTKRATNQNSGGPTTGRPRRKRSFPAGGRT